MCKKSTESVKVPYIPMMFHTKAPNVELNFKISISRAINKGNYIGSPTFPQCNQLGSANTSQPPPHRSA